MEKIPLIHFTVPQTCIVCRKREESSENFIRLDLNEFKPEQLAKLPGKYLGQWVHREMKCFGTIKKILNTQ